MLFSRATGDDDVTLKILYCGICHTDLHSIKNDWGNAMYPMVPGYKSYFAKFKVGDKVGIGYMVGSCGSCESCSEEYENHCFKMITTSNGVYHDGTTTYGGFSDMIVVNEHFAVHIPDNLPLEKTAPLLCAGVTVYSPMKHFGLNEPGKHLGVVGLGGLGHVAVKFGKAYGMKVTVISTSRNKEQEAIQHLGADSFLAAIGTMDGIIDTVSAFHPIAPLLLLLKARGRMILVGVPNKPLELPSFCLIQGMRLLSFYRTSSKVLFFFCGLGWFADIVLLILSGGRMLAGGSVGGMKDTQEMIDFAGKHNITADVEVVGIDYVNTAIVRLEKGDVRYRFVVDVANTLTTA
ncbi:hypothetical protein GW17_00010722 [Ensete ventricosum]|nr:hypothetical protein GW17_00010722 [Ensete ventricosum]